MKTATFLLSLLFPFFFTGVDNSVVQNDMLAISKQVLNDLKKSKGIFPEDKPHLSLETLPEGKKIAVIDVKDGSILLDPKTYLIARSLGKDSLNALAFILGHELGHYIHQHGIINHHVESTAPQAVQINSDAMNQTMAVEFQDKVEESNKVYNEAEADFEGAFLGYLAGYQPSRAGKKLLSKIYNDPGMNLNDAGPGYPTLAQRLEIISKTEREITELTPYFDLANYLMSIGQYQDAIPYLEKVLEKFQSREIYNNIGVLQILESLRIFEEPPIDYKVPLTLDANFRAPHPDFVDEDEDGIVDLLSPDGWIQLDPCEISALQKKMQETSIYFKKAIGLDQNYAPALLNLSIAQMYEAILSKKIVRSSQMLQCNALRDDQLFKAKANALEALHIAKQAMSEYMVSHFEMHNNVEERPYKHVSFNELISYREASPIYQLPVRNEWKNRIQNAETPMPKNAFLVSNILLQLDLISILQDGGMDNSTIQKPKPFSFQDSSSYFEVPFTRALEINPQNQLAKYNMAVATGTPLPSSTVQNQASCNSIEKHDKNSVREVEQIIDSKNLWDKQDRLTTQRLNEDRIEIQQNQSFQHKSFVDFTMLWNESKVDQNKREEKSMFMIPKDFHKSKTECGIKTGDDWEMMTSKYGFPDQSIELTGGNFHMYFLQLRKRPLYKEGTLPQGLKGKKVRIFGMDLFEISESEMNASLASPSIFLQEEDGIIFKTNAEGKVQSWIIFYREIKTEGAEV